jgi:FdhD protein
MAGTSRGRTSRALVTKVVLDPSGAVTSRRRNPDDLIVEEPMSIQLDGTLVSTTMRTPGHDFELAVGFCFTEGMLGGATVTGVRYCADGSAVESEFNVVTVETGGRAPAPTPRLGNTSSSCGICGTEQLAELATRLEPLPSTEPFDLPLLHAIPDAVMGDQELFNSTGASHAAAAFDRAGALIVTREDVGRHNAVDKVVGWMALHGHLGHPAGDGPGLFISGRASIEMIQKAWAAGFSHVLSVSAPTALAVEAARRANITLAGFHRQDGFNLYT